MKPVDQAEVYILGAMAIDGDTFSEVMQDLTSDDFSTNHRKLMFAAIVKLVVEKTHVDEITLGEALPTIPRNVIAEITMQIPSKSGLPHYIQIVKRHSKLRRLNEMADMIRRSVGDHDDPDEIIAKCNEVISIASALKANTVCEFAEAAHILLYKLEHGIVESGCTIAYPQLGRMLGQLKNGRFYICGARPGMGKTTFGINIVMNLANDGHNVLIFSLEMPKEQIVGNMLSIETSINSRIWDKMIAQKADIEKIRQTLERKRGDIVIDDDSSMTPDLLSAKIRDQKQKRKLDFVLIDYIQLMQSPMYKDNRVNEMSHISNSVKRISKTQEVPILALAQLNRVSADGKLPTLSDLRDSGSFEQDADVVMLLYRPEYFSAKDRPGELDVIIAKNRAGPTGKVTLDICLPTSKITSRE